MAIELRLNICHNLNIKIPGVSTLTGKPMTTPSHRSSEAVQSLHIEHLSIQLDHLLFVRERHLQWMGETANVEIRVMHHRLADLLEQAEAQYENLIEALLEEREGK